MNGVVPYGSGNGRVIVYDTFANGGALAFGVMLPQEEAKVSE